MTFRGTISRTGYGCGTFETEAATREEAEGRLLRQASDAVFSDHASDYAVESLVIVHANGVTEQLPPAGGTNDAGFVVIETWRIAEEIDDADRHLGWSEAAREYVALPPDQAEEFLAGIDHESEGARVIAALPAQACRTLAVALRGGAR